MVLQDIITYLIIMVCTLLTRLHTKIKLGNYVKTFYMAKCQSSNKSWQSANLT